MKCFISAYSPVLTKLIEEAGTKTKMEVLGAGFHAFRRIYDFIYTGGFDVDVPVFFLEELIEAANKFKVKGLKSAGEEALKAMLKKSNAKALFKIAQRKQLESLKLAVRSLVEK